MSSREVVRQGGLLGLDNIRAIGQDGLISFLMKGWQEHGDFYEVKLGRQLTYVVTHPDYVHHMALGHGDIYGKGRTYEPVRKYLLGDSIVPTDGDVWQWQRRMLAPFFTPRAVGRYAQMMVDESQKLLGRLQMVEGNVVDMSEEMLKVASGIILRSIFGMEREHQAQVLADVNRMIRYTSTRMFPFVMPDWVPTEQNSQYWEARERLHTYIKRVIAEREQMEQADWPDDLLSQMLVARQDEEWVEMTDDMLINESLSLFIAGHETTARTMAFTTYLLSKNEEAERRVVAEVASVLGGRSLVDAPLTVDDLKRMPYLLQAIKETLRLYPTVVAITRDVFKDDEIDGYQLKAGNRMMMFAYGTHRHPDFWEEPEAFRPERFEPEAEQERHPYAYYPFAVGQRVCVGNNFALLEAQIVLAMLYSQYRPRLLAGHDPQIKMLGTVVPTNGMPMQINPVTLAVR